jgi:hypothetical protein
VKANAEAYAILYNLYSEAGEFVEKYAQKK